MNSESYETSISTIERFKTPNVIMWVYKLNVFSKSYFSIIKVCKTSNNNNIRLHYDYVKTKQNEQLIKSST